MITKICTDIEQSKKLTELGIDINTADIIYNIFDKSYIRHDTHIDKYHMPAWSLTALLKLIPNWTMDKTDKVNLTCNSYYHCESCYEEPVDAAFEIVCWLKENNKI